MNLKELQVEDQDNIFEVIVSLMEEAQKIKNLSGQERKNVVLSGAV